MGIDQPKCRRRARAVGRYDDVLTVFLVTLVFLGLNTIAWWNFGATLEKPAFGWPLTWGLGDWGLGDPDISRRIWTLGDYRRILPQEVNWIAFAFNDAVYVMVLGIAVVLRKGRFGIHTMFALMIAAVLLFSLCRFGQINSLSEQRQIYHFNDMLMPRRSGVALPH